MSRAEVRLAPLPLRDTRPRRTGSEARSPTLLLQRRSVVRAQATRRAQRWRAAVRPNRGLRAAPPGSATSTVAPRPTDAGRFGIARMMESARERLPQSDVRDPCHDRQQHISVGENGFERPGHLRKCLRACREGHRRVGLHPSVRLSRDREAERSRQIPKLL
jgi:hypothetical protein